MENLVQIFQKIILGTNKSWVLFKNGTCVILMEPEENLKQQAIKILKECGPVHVATASADFGTIELEENQGWVVTCHHPDILNYVSEENFDESPSDVVIGITGRSKRDLDAKDLEVIHVEDNRF